MKTNKTIRKIRIGTFETNSSSMHSLVVKKKNDYFTKEEVEESFYIDSTGCIDLEEEDLSFGRSPFQILSTIKDKALYVLASMCNTKGDSIYNQVCNVIREYIPDFKGYHLEPKVNTISKKYYSEDEVVEHYGEDNYTQTDDYWITWDYRFGCIEENILEDFLNDEQISIAEFLKNKKYIVVVDGDEYCIYSDMKELGLINIEELEKEYPERN